ncbi:CAP domain-containing protein [Paenibacillus taiwanensis]|uniref:CAP domain-containing protein n=1 Tax=Paenibacillus taiwanensis TaxID=401638 RepID=UPI00040619A2|nr:CAP domain-containing protein [Paenibacillus taiwanensis]
MKKQMQKVVIVGALALAPVLSAGSVMAAPATPTDCNVSHMKVNSNSPQVTQNTVKWNMNGQDWSALLSKWFPQFKQGEQQQENKNNSGQVKVEQPKQGGTENKGQQQPSNGNKDQNKQEQPANVSDFAKQVAELVNKERATAGLAPLKLDTKLSEVAMKKAKDMYDNNYFDHQSPTYGSPFDMMKANGIQYSTAGENIAKGQRTPAEVMNAWMNSDGHRKNIMNASFTTIGVAYYNGEWVQQFIG